MTWETDKVFEYIQNDESVLEDLKNKTAESILEDLEFNEDFKNYIVNLFLGSVDFKELENNLCDPEYSVELGGVVDYCFPLDVNEETVKHSTIQVDIGFAIYDENGSRDCDEEKQVIEDEIASELFDFSLTLNDKSKKKTLQNYIAHELMDDIDWIYEEVENNMDTEIKEDQARKKLYLGVIFAE